MKSKRLTIANSITVSRLIFALAGFILMILDRWILAFVMIFMAIGLDFIDGRIARSMHESSEFGTFLDIMVDKIIFISSFLMIGVHIDMIFFYIGIIVLAREYTMDTMRAIAASNNKVIPADKLSKTKGALYGTSIILMIGTYALSNATSNINSILSNIATIMACVGVIFAYITLCRFFILHRNVLE